MAICPELKGVVVCIDTETAILGDRICEIGVSIFYNGKEVGTYGTLVNPQVPIDPNATAVHHITDQDVINAPVFQQVVDVVYSFLVFADVIVAYNSQYDRDVIGKELTRIGLVWPEKPIVDPFILFKKYYKFNKGKKLVDMAEKFGFTYLGAHRAVNDATMTGKCLFRLAETNIKFPKVLKELLKNQRKWIEEQYLDYYDWCQKSGKKLPDQPQYQYYEYGLV